MTAATQFGRKEALHADRSNAVVSSCNHFMSPGELGKHKIASDATIQANAGGEPEVFVGKTRALGGNTSGFQWANWGKWIQGHEIHEFPIELGVWDGRS